MLISDEGNGLSNLEACAHYSLYLESYIDSNSLVKKNPLKQPQIRLQHCKGHSDCSACIQRSRKFCS